LAKAHKEQKRREKRVLKLKQRSEERGVELAPHVRKHITPEAWASTLYRQLEQ
jgi:hypothetical protein